MPKNNGMDSNPLIKHLYENIKSTDAKEGKLEFSFVIDDEKWNFKVILEKVEI
jgi:quinol monooxygenase YgiN